MLTEEKIWEILNDLVAGTPLFIVDVKLKANDRIVIDADSDAGITVDDCASLNHALQEKLEALSIDAELEISSPGIGKPFRVLRQYKKNTGRTVLVQLLDGNSCQGILRKADDKGIVLVLENTGKKKSLVAEPEVSVLYNEIKSTKAVIKF
jgi:ribosome maturation factor RimP